jgi:hypothetical protein
MDISAQIEYKGIPYYLLVIYDVHGATNMEIALCLLSSLPHHCWDLWLSAC